MFKKYTIVFVVVIAFALSLSVAFAQNGLTIPGTTATGTPPVRYTLDLACMQTAVGGRDTAIIAATDVFYSAMKSALETRKAELVASWGLTIPVERRATRRAACNKFYASSKQARTALRAAKKSAWDKFYADSKACKGVASDELGGRGIDANW